MNIEKNEFSNELAKLQLQFRWESEIERESDRKENTQRQRERERKEGGRYSLLLSETSADPRCFSMAAFFSRSPWYATFDMCFVFCLMRNVSGSSATCRHMNEEACECERKKWAGHTDLCKFAFGLLEIRMVFYIRLNFRILSNALQFGCIGNCCCLGLGYVSAKKQKKKHERRGKSEDGYEEKFKLPSASFSTQCISMQHVACGMLWHTVVAVVVAARKLTLQQLLLHPHLAALGANSISFATAHGTHELPLPLFSPITSHPLSSRFPSSLWEKPLTPIWQFYQLKQHFFSLAGILIRAAFLTDFPPPPLVFFPQGN